MEPFSHLHDRRAVRSGVEIGLFNIPQGERVLHAPACPIEKVTLWDGLLYLTSRSETWSVVKDKTFARTRNETMGTWPKAQYIDH